MTKLLGKLIPAHVRYAGIRSFAKWKVWYDKGIGVLSVIRNVQLMDLGIIMALAKYMFGDQLSNAQIIAIGASYWVLNTVVNTTVGWFWEHHQGWKIEAEVRAQRVDATRTVLVSPSGDAYSLHDLASQIAKELKDND